MERTMAQGYRAVSLWQGLRYKGREGMWTWLLHRATGLGILLFLLLHVVDTAIIIYRPDVYEELLGLYKSPVIRFAELAIFFAVLYHGVNGLRIIVQDFWPAVMLRQRQLSWATAAIVGVATLFVGWLMIAPLFGWRDEPGTERHRQRMQERGVTAHVIDEAATEPLLEVEL
jgi:succinate dehydrogenase / fumarate reductase, cytochrome b subunit